MKLKKVINLFGGPGSGKSTCAAALFALMKKKGMSVELVSEYAKQMVFEERLNVLKEDQLYVFAKQHRKILTLRNTVEYVITDSPFVQGYLYLNDDSIYDRNWFRSLIMDTFHKYPNYNVLLVRGGDIPYEQMGRYQNEKEAQEVGASVAQFLANHNIQFTTHIAGHDEKYILRGI